MYNGKNKNTQLMVRQLQKFHFILINMLNMAPKLRTHKTQCNIVSNKVKRVATSSNKY